jgi:RNA polymerase sigma-70 factor (ECF subfamily)
MLATAAPTTSYRMPSPSDGAASERAIVVAAQQGSDDAFSALVRIHQRRAYAIVRAIVLSHEDAEDAVQEGFLHAHRALDRFRPDQPFGAWLYRIMTHLTDRQRAVIVMHDVEGFTHGEIGRTLGIPEGTARSDLHHARAALRRLLQNLRSRS